MTSRRKRCLPALLWSRVGVRRWRRWAKRLEVLELLLNLFNLMQD